MDAAQRTVQLSSGELTWFEAGSGRPLLHLHPAGGVRWTRVLEGLARSHKLYVPVMPGFDGTPEHAGVASMQSLGKLLGEFVDGAIGSACDVIGHSFGGWLACWLALERPDRVDHLVLESPAGFRRGPAAADAALFAHPEKLPPGHKSEAMDAANRLVPGRYHGGRFPDEDLIARIGSMERLTLILQGTEDRVAPKESVQRLKGLLKRSYLIYVWDAAHGIEVDQPERTLAVIESFFARSEAFVVNWGRSTNTTP
jgi:pimeloyl-ACP methyl ester carboxylesterase